MIDRYIDRELKVGLGYYWALVSRVPIFPNRNVPACTAWNAPAGPRGNLMTRHGLWNAWNLVYVGAERTVHVQFYLNLCPTNSVVYKYLLNMGKFSLSRLIMCAKYQRLTSEDYIRLGLCDPLSCPDCSEGSGHYVKNDKMVRFFFFF